MNKKPKELNAKLTHELLEQNKIWGDTSSIQGYKNGAPFFVNSEIGMLHDAALPFQQLVQQFDAPLSISDYRLGIILRGEGRAIINLTEHHFAAGTMVFVGPGTIIQPLEMSPDMNVKGLAVFQSFPLPFTPERTLALFSAPQPFLLLRPDAANLAIAGHLLDTIWNVVNLRYEQDVIVSLVAAVFSHWNRVYLSHSEQGQKSSSRNQEIFDHFIQLINRYAAQEHQIAFYADRLCLSERYLGTVVHLVSGVTAKEWIDRALVMKIKVMLRHTSLTLKQIADDLNFQNPSFFSKYFKRLTGITPGDYRMG